MNQRAQELQLEPLRKCDLLGGDEGPSDLELDLCVREERDAAWVAGEDASVEERGDGSVGGTDLGAVEWLSPDVEEVAERVRALDRRFGMDDSVGRVGVEPHEASGARDERAARGSFDLVWRCGGRSRRPLVRGAAGGEGAGGG